jgi:hypothetical protein
MKVRTMGSMNAAYSPPNANSGIPTSTGQVPSALACPMRFNEQLKLLLAPFYPDLRPKGALLRL